MIVKGILILLAVVVIIGGVLMQSKEKGVALAIVLVLLSFAGDVLSEVTADMIKPLFFGAESTAEEGERRPDSTSAVQAETVLSPAPQPEPEPAPETPSAPVTEPAGDPEPAPAPETSPEPEAPPAPEPPADPLSGLSDVSGLSSFSGNLTGKEQVDQYRYTAPTSGIYRFDTGVSYGGVSMEAKDQAGRRVDGGRNALTVSLRAGELYTLSVFQEYMSLPAEYTVSVTAQQDPA